MRKTLARQTRAMFKQKLISAYPAIVEKSGLEIPPGCRVFEWPTTQTLTFYVLLIISPRSDQFTLDIAWSEKGIFPARWGGLTLPSDPPRNGSMRFRIRHLSPLSRPNEDVWWNLVPVLDERKKIDFDVIQQLEPSETDAIGKIVPAVEAALEQFSSTAVPYFQSVAKAHGTVLREKQSNQAL